MCASVSGERGREGLEKIAGRSEGAFEAFVGRKGIAVGRPSL